MFLEYIIFFHYFVFAICLGLLLFFSSFLLVYQKPYIEKVSPYECGFNPWGDARIKFEVRFYLVAILFIIFDLEIVFLYPFIINLFNFSLFAFYCFVVFMVLLTLGFVYEWRKGALEWE